jgi:hypothetical protein
MESISGLDFIYEGLLNYLERLALEYKVVLITKLL